MTISDIIYNNLISYLILLSLQLTNFSSKSVIISGAIPKKDADALASISELESLITTLNLPILGKFIQAREFPHNKTLIGKGKIQEIQDFISESGLDKQNLLIIFNHELQPSQSNILENEFEVEVWDRTWVILEIFAQHARTYEAKIQVELAKNTYNFSRLKGMWTHLDRERGSIRGSRGMGEKQIQIDRRIIANNITRLKKKLEKIENKRNLQKKQRRDFFKISLIGYTNVGKSCLFNLLTDSTELSIDKKFATLDSKIGKLAVSDNVPIIIADTVGFIKNLPHSLVASFRSTLNAIDDSSWLIHLIDISAENIKGHIDTTLEVLSKIDCEDIPTLLVFNKIDLVDPIKIKEISTLYPDSLFVSMIEGDAKKTLLDTIYSIILDDYISMESSIPYSDSSALSKLYDYAIVKKISFDDDKIRFSAMVPKKHQKSMMKICEVSVTNLNESN